MALFMDKTKVLQVELFFPYNTCMNSLLVSSFSAFSFYVFVTLTVLFLFLGVPLVQGRATTKNIGGAGVKILEKMFTYIIKQ